MSFTQEEHDVADLVGLLGLFSWATAMDAYSAPIGAVPPKLGLRLTWLYLSFANHAVVVRRTHEVWVRFPSCSPLRVLETHRCVGRNIND